MQMKGGTFVEVYLFPLYIRNGLPNGSDWGTEIFLQQL